MNKYCLLVKFVQATSYGREMFHPTMGTLSITLSLYSEATPNMGYVSTKGGTRQAHSYPHTSNSLFPS